MSAEYDREDWLTVPVSRTMDTTGGSVEMEETIVHEESRSVYLAIASNRKSFAQWAELYDCLLVEKDLPDYREAFDVGPDATRIEILASAMEEHYFEAMPCIEGPFMDLLCSAFNGLDWLWIAERFLERVSTGN